MEKLVIQKAERSQVKLLIGLKGPTNAGKTYSALKIATGMNRGKIALIDTEHRRSEFYADEFDFDVIHLDPPFSPERYVEAIELVEAQGYGVIIVDSISHEWAGKGGILEDADNMPGNSFTKWKTLTPRHNKFVDKLTRTNAHLIVTIRAKDDYVLEENSKGKMEPKKVGMGSIQRDGLDFEFTVLLLLDNQTHNIIAEKDNTHLFETRYDKLSEKDGVALIDWAQKGKPPKTYEQVEQDIKAAQTQDDLTVIYRGNPHLQNRILSLLTARKNEILSGNGKRKEGALL